VRPRTVRGKIIANSVVILSLLAAATLYSEFTSLELDRSVEALFRNNLVLEQIETTLDQTEANFSEYLRTKSSDSLKDYIKTSTRLSEQAQGLSQGVVSEDILLLQWDLTRAFDSYLRATEAGVEAKRARDISGYADKFETAGRHAAGARILIADLQSTFLSRSLQAFSTYRGLIPGVLLSDAVLVLAATLLGFSLLWGYSRALTEPLSRLAVAAAAVGRGDYQADLPLVDTHDEIGTLARTFDQMRQGVRQSFQDIQARAEVERTLLEERMHVLELGHRLKDAELVALQTQINPHFLFNTLAAGVELAGTEEATRTEDFLQNLAVFIRYALTPPGRFVAVADEIECVKRYVWLLRLRFRQRFTFDVQVDENLLGFEIPALILQPLVENSVGHGLADRESGGHVIVRGVADQDGAVLSVRDNGAGMERTEMDAILSESAGELPALHGIGLRNVIRRILLSTNGRGRVELGGGPGEGLEVKIFVPRYSEGGTA
jgi:sensor histidine kinase YesM